MKIDGNHGHSHCSAVRLDARPSDRARTRTGAGDGAGGDRVEISAGMEVVSAALRAAADAPEVRSDAVERARLKLESGQLGQDLQRLADLLIDHALLGR